MLQKTEIARETGWSEDTDDSLTDSHPEQDTPVDPSASARAPIEDALLDAEDLVAPNQVNTERPPWRHPLPRTILVVMGTGIIGVGVLQLTEGNSLIRPSENQAALNSTSTSIPKPVGGDKGDLQAQIATFELRQKINNINKARQAEKKSANIAKAPTHPKPQPTPVTKPPQRVVAYNPPPQYVSPPRTTWVAARPQQSPKRQEVQVSVPKDPMEQWLAAANVGSYGQVSSGNNNTQTASVSSGAETSDYQTVEERTSDATKNNSNFSLSGGIGETPAKTNRPLAQSNNSTEQLNVNYPVRNANSRAELAIGTKAKGKLIDAITWAGVEELANQNYVIKLKEPLKGNNGLDLVPKGARLIARVTQTPRGSFLSMSVVQIQTPRQTVNVPPGSILVLNKKGGMLQAKAEQPDSSGAGVGRALLYGASGVLGLRNQASSRTVFGAGGYESVLSNSERDYAAAFGQGITQGILQDASERNQQAIQATQSQPIIYHLDEGFTVRIKVNRPVPF